MKTNFLFLLISTLLIVGLTGCSSKKSSSNQDTITTSSTDTTTSNSDTTTNTLDATTSTTETETIFTLLDLAKYDGIDGKLAYVAINGVVYDVTNEKGWKNGEHQGYSAGKDLTDVISKSPHGESVLKDLTAVGKLE